MAGNDWFPLHFRRLRTSKWWRRASDMARARNVFLWGEAYAATPAGSLADDDDELAEAAGFGFDVDAWMAAKAEIMAPWIMCSDGRWYHPTVCEMVLEAWDRQSAKRKADAERKAAQRAKTRKVTPKDKPVTQDNEDVPRDNAENQRDIAIHDRQDITGQDRQDSIEAIASQAPDLPVAQAIVVSKPKKPRKAKSPSSNRCPEDWDPSEAHSGLARELGYTAQHASRELANFRDHHFTKPKTDWDATFRTWLRNSAPNTGKFSGTGSPAYPNRGTANAASRNEALDLGARKAVDGGRRRWGS